MNQTPYTYDELRYLLDRAQRGSLTWASKVPQDDDGLTDQEVAAVVAQLDQTTDRLHKLILMKILGYAVALTHRGGLEQYLRGPDVTLAANALYILCEFWGLTPEYSNEIQAYIEGVPWDPGRTLRKDGLRYAQEYLRGHTGPTLLRATIRLYEDPGESEEAHLDALDSLAYLANYPDLPPAEIIRMAKDRLANEGTRVDGR